MCQQGSSKCRGGRDCVLHGCKAANGPGSSGKPSRVPADEFQHTTPAYESSEADSLNASMPVGGGEACRDVVEDVHDTAHNVQVMVRIRPPNRREIGLVGQASCLQQRGVSGLLAQADGRDCEFNFDHVISSDGTQEELFNLVGVPMVNNVMQGYNACCLAYGQTGAGKTHTILGDVCNASSRIHDLHTMRPGMGLTPRIFHRIFEMIESKEGHHGGTDVQYTCRCSFLQIYKEHLSDLLRPLDEGRSLPLRSDSDAGVFVEGLSDHVILNVEDAMKLMLQGARARSMRETRVNRHSSGGHTVFTARVECRTTMASGARSVRSGVLHVVDLAGSERVKVSAVTGTALTEAREINRSLSALGRVISKVVEAQRTRLPGRHIPFRDSKLTFLLRDSLGGNAKTVLIANVSESDACAHETLSTLLFAQSAKCVRNRAVVNVDTQGEARALKAEIKRLQAELSRWQDGVTAPLVKQCEELKALVGDRDAQLHSMAQDCEAQAEENRHLKYQLRRLDSKLVAKDRDMEKLAGRLAQHEIGHDGAVEEGYLEALHSAQPSSQPALSATLRHADDLLVAARADTAARAARAAVEMDAALAAMHDDTAHELAAMAELHAVAFEDAIGKVEGMLRCAAAQHREREPARGQHATHRGANGALHGLMRGLRNSGELRRNAQEDVEAARRFGHDAMLRCVLGQAMEEKMAPWLARRPRGDAATGEVGPAMRLLSAVLAGDAASLRSQREAFAEHRERTRQLMLR
eukprot:jgi/Ulvmu1/3449/UM016_0069.1